MTIDENRLKSDVKNFTETFGIDLKINIIDQTKTFSIANLCSLIAQERRDTILIADLYTKEIDLISRSLKLPTIAMINRYQIVHGKLVRREFLNSFYINSFFYLFSIILISLNGCLIQSKKQNHYHIILKLVLFILVLVKIIISF